MSQGPDAGAGTCRAAVLGKPIEHSLSPALHRAGYAALGLSRWRYEAISCDEAQLPDLLAGLGAEWAGLSLTMPLKRTVIPLLGGISPLAEAVGAVNTVLWPAPGGPPAGPGFGENTDVAGIVAALAEVGVGAGAAGGLPVTSAVVLGGGATACSALAALRELGCPEPLVQVRSRQRAAELLLAAERLGVRPTLTGFEDVDAVLAADVVVCTLPADAGAAWAGTLPSTGGRAAGVLLDVAYHPWPTAAATAWQRLGGTAIGGLAMLLHQAAEQFRLMTGHPAPLAAMRSALPTP